MKYSRIAFIFPGQGSQYIGMGKDLTLHFPLAKRTFEEADDILERNLSSLIFEGTDAQLMETRNSQLAIYVVSMAILRVLNHLYPDLKPAVCAGHSLGEYSALTASHKASFTDTLSIIQWRSHYMNEACQNTRGGMAALIGVDGDMAEKIVAEVNLPQELWTANFNCPGQVVISGTLKGIEAGMAAAKAKGVKRALPLQVHGAFHSGLMWEAEKKLSPHLSQLSLKESSIPLVMNVLGDYVTDLSMIRQNLIKQVTSPVRWEQGVRAMAREGVELFLELGGGKILSGLNNRIGVTSAHIEKTEDLARFEKEILVVQ